MSLARGPLWGGETWHHSCPRGASAVVGETDFIQESYHVMQTHSCGAQERPGAVRDPDRKAQRGRPGKVSQSSCSWVIWRKNRSVITLLWYYAMFFNERIQLMLTSLGHRVDSPWQMRNWDLAAHELPCDHSVSQCSAAHGWGTRLLRAGPWDDYFIFPFPSL